MAIEGELNGLNGTLHSGISDFDGKWHEVTLPLRVLSTRAGYYLGYACADCGPISRETNYMTEADANLALAAVKDTTGNTAAPASLEVRDTYYHPGKIRTK